MKLKIIIILIVYSLGNAVDGDIVESNTGSKNSFKKLYELIINKFTDTNKKLKILEEKINKVQIQLDELENNIANYIYLIEENKNELRICTEDKEKDDKLSKKTHTNNINNRVKSGFMTKKSADNNYKNKLLRNEKRYKECLNDSQNFTALLSHAQEEINIISDELDMIDIDDMKNEKIKIKNKLLRLTEQMNKLKLKAKNK